MMEALERPRKVLEHQPEANHYDTLERDRMAAEQSTQTTPERWLPVPGYEGYYEVSDYGRVRSLEREVYSRQWGNYRRVPGRYLSLGDKGRGYRAVNMCREGKQRSAMVHRLVTSAFVGPCPAGMEVCHKNGDPSDNRLANLRYGTSSENKRDSVRHGTHRESRKTHCSRGHELTGSNLEESKLKRGERGCLACQRARSYIKHHPEMKEEIQRIADSYYRSIER